MNHILYVMKEAFILWQSTPGSTYPVYTMDDDGEGGWLVVVPEVNKFEVAQ